MEWESDPLESANYRISLLERELDEIREEFPANTDDDDNLLSVINRHFDDRAKIVAARAVKSAINAALDQIRELAINNNDVKGEKLRLLIMASEEVAKVDQRFLADHVNVTSFDPW